MAKQMGFIGCIMVVVVVCLSFAGSSEGRRYVVGDSFGWSIPPNETFYSDWASSKTFLVGDSLVFNWTGEQNVAEVPKADYNNCSTVAVPFTGIPNRNRTVFTVTLLYPGHRYFICTVDDHCEKGQKFSIDVKWPFSSTPSPAPIPSSS